jgi:hypothetical protein
MRLEDPLEVFQIEMIDVGASAPVAEVAVR